jgi:hypothetical protein
MTEFSGLWTTGGAGDGASTYTRAQLSDLFKVLGACMDNEGVAPGYLNACAVSANGANSARVATGGALVDGIMYSNSANVDTNIPSAVGGGNTRIDRLVLRADWTAQTVRVTRIAGTDAASPSAPAITSSAGTTYDLKLAQVLVDTSGTVTITDERVLARPGALSLANNTAYSGSNAAATAIKPLLAINSSDQVALFSAGQGVKIINNAQDTVLFNITDGGTVSLAVGLPTAAYAADSVDDTVVGNRVPQFYRRQGGDATSWAVDGTTTYTPTSVRQQAGAYTIGSVGSGSNVLVTGVTFPTAFSAAPIVLATAVIASAASGDQVTVAVSNVTATTFDMAIKNTGGSTETVSINWLAIGPE